MAAIYLSLIEDERIKKKLRKDSYKKLKEQLTAIVYPQSEIRLLDIRLEVIKQNQFEFITDYYDEIEKHIEIYSHIHSLNNKETERKFSEVFHRGLGHYTYLEILKQNMQKTSTSKICDYLKDLEEGILLQGNLAKMKLNNNVSNYQHAKNYTGSTSNTPIFNNKWCSIHCMQTHNTKDCALRNNFKNDSLQNQNLLVINQKQNPTEKLNIVDKDTMKKKKIEKSDNEDMYCNLNIDKQADENKTNQKIKKVKDSLKLKTNVREEKTNNKPLIKIIANKQRTKDEIKSRIYNKTNMPNIRKYKKGVKLKKLRKSYKTKRKRAFINLDKFTKSVYQPPPVVKTFKEKVS
ncbi:hypothetical protein NAPIS_ORF02502 [Vairimorpha apis BRL 01]|uniref:Retrotransposon gag domain-containing protein n=1 Tax=Vairimorpha apis BRL 01 TaxID=1037528 RepID=T0KX59_9MICR|nr:hypothetical protein NAPIS_ORF02502 [Vairimorpha apis BRL 01]